MKVKTIKILSGMLAVLAFTACSSNIDESADAPRFYNVTLTASMGDGETRALSEGADNAIIASFAENDEVKVVKADGSLVGTLTAQTAGAKTTLTGTITGEFSVNEVLTLRYRSETANYGGQVGTLVGIAAGQDYAEGTLKVTSTSPSLTFESNSVTLKAKQSITKFTFSVNVKNFRIAANGLVRTIAANGTETVGDVTGALGTASTDVYVALRNNTDVKQTYSFTIQDVDGNWYTGTKKANLANGKNYAASVTLTPMPTLTSGNNEGTIGVVGGLPAIVVDFSGTKKAVALMNVGAIWPEDYGTYYIFSEKASGLSNDWYVPSQTELTSFKDTYSSTWGAPHGVNGRTFTIGGNTLFLPAAGYIDNDVEVGEEPVRSGKELVSTFGYYWSQTEVTPSGSMAYSYQFSASINDTYSEYKVNALTVRPFHALPAQ